MHLKVRSITVKGGTDAMVVFENFLTLRDAFNKKDERGGKGDEKCPDGKAIQ